MDKYGKCNVNCWYMFKRCKYTAANLAGMSGNETAKTEGKQENNPQSTHESGAIGSPSV